MTKKQQQITRLSASGELTELYINGVISHKVLMYRDIYYDLDIQIKQGRGKMESLQATADRFGVSINTVYRAFKFMIG